MSNESEKTSAGATATEEIAEPAWFSASLERVLAKQLKPIQKELVELKTRVDKLSVRWEEWRNGPHGC